MPYDINNAGQIVGVGARTSRVELTGVVLTPVNLIAAFFAICAASYVMYRR